MATKTIVTCDVCGKVIPGGSLDAEDVTLHVGVDKWEIDEVCADCCDALAEAVSETLRKRGHISGPTRLR